jgi:quinohemoprotein ethanol dehydrogenase
MRLIRHSVAAVAVLLMGCDSTPGPPPVDSERLAAAASDPTQWMTAGRTYAEERYSPLSAINAESIDKLGLAWSYEFDTSRGQEATPLIVDGVLYTTTAWSKVFAFDAKAGSLLWSYDPKVEGSRAFVACCDVVNRGLAVWEGKVFVGALDGRLIALDAANGSEVWSTVTVDQSRPYTITGAPRIVKGKVLIGNGGAEYGVRGYLSAYDAETGELAWRFYTTPNPDGQPDDAASDSIMESTADATWSDGLWTQSGGGGTVWDAMAYDPDLDLLYFGVGNGAPWSHELRSGGEGDNLFLSSIVAVRPDDGAYVWHYQTTPGETWDYTATQHIILADLTIDGQPRQVLMQAPKNGFFYVLDRKDGSLISANNYVTVTWATGVGSDGRPVEVPEARYDRERSLALVLPSPFGGHNWHPMAFDPAEGLVFIPTIEMAFPFMLDPAFTYRDGNENLGIELDVLALPTDEAQLQAMKAGSVGQLVAWDPVKQEARWTVQHPYFWNAGVLATAGGLVFQGDAEGRFSAYSTAKGELLWGFDTQNGVIAAPAAYEIDGEQYVAVMVGLGGAGPLKMPWALPDRPRLPGRLLVFKLGGTATIAPYPIPEPVTMDLSGVTSPGDARAGFALYNDNCGTCHGSSVSGRWLPNLKTSPMILSSEAFASVVMDGALSANGMIGFSRFLKGDEAESIRAYILSEARRTPAGDSGGSGQ